MAGQQQPGGGPAPRGEMAALKAHGLTENAARQAQTFGLSAGTIGGWLKRYGPAALQLLEEVLNALGGGAGAVTWPAPELTEIKAHGLTDASVQKAQAAGLSGGNVLAWILKYGPAAVQILNELLDILKGMGGANAAAPAGA